MNNYTQPLTAEEYAQITSEANARELNKTLLAHEGRMAILNDNNEKRHVRRAYAMAALGAIISSSERSPYSDVRDKIALAFEYADAMMVAEEVV